MTERLPKPCKRCNQRFTPITRFSRICPMCKKIAMENRIYNNRGKTWYSSKNNERNFN